MKPSRENLELTNEKVQLIWKQHHLGTVQTVKKINKGLNNQSFIINNNKILRISRRDSSRHLKKEQFISELLQKKYVGFPVPKVIAHNYTTNNIFSKPYQINTFLKGTTLNEVMSEEKRNIKRIGMELGKRLSQIHNIRFQHSGLFELQEQKDTYEVDEKEWKTLHEKEFYNNIKVLQKESNIKEEILQEYLEFYNEIQRTIEVTFQPSLLHHDLNMDNFHIEEDKVTGIFDFEWSFAGHNEYELAMIEFNWFEKYPELREPFLKEYTKEHKLTTDYEKRIFAYGFLNKVMALAGIYIDDEPQDPNKYVKQINKLIQQYNEKYM
ncbi:MAG: phosphotransferase [Nanobdellota archaeon]